MSERRGIRWLLVFSVSLLALLLSACSVNSSTSDLPPEVHPVPSGETSREGAVQQVHKSRRAVYQQPTPVPTEAIPTPAVAPRINIRADSSVIREGQCTILRWNVGNIREIYLNGQGVIGDDTRQVCPKVTTTYTFYMILTDGSPFYYPYTITVESQGIPDKLDFMLQANYGGQALSSYFPSTFRFTLSSGGGVDVSYLDESCTGYATAAPDLEVYFNQSTFNPLRFSLVTHNPATLIVNAPNGAWYCASGDEASAAPIIEFAEPLQGTYDIWAASLTEGVMTTGTIHIMEVTENDR